MTGNDYKYGLNVGRGLDEAIIHRRQRALANPKEDKLFNLILKAEEKEVDK